MYICICCDITEKDIEENPELLDLVGSVCGSCIDDGGEMDSTRLVNPNGQPN